MCEIGDYSSNGGGDKVGKPNKVVVFDDKIRKNCKKSIVKTRNQNSYYEITEGVFRSFDVCFVF